MVLIKSENSMHVLYYLQYLEAKNMLYVRDIFVICLKP